MSFHYLQKSTSSKLHTQKGFTLLELLLVVAIIAILASVIFVVLDPPTRFKNTRDSARFTDVRAISNAIKLDQLDNGGDYLHAIASITADTPYIISNATTTAGCIVTCDVTITAGDHCVNLTGLVTSGHLGQIPISPEGTGTWTSAVTGYYVQRNTNGSISVGACESENISTIVTIQ